WILAIRQTQAGQQVVVIKPDGTVIDSPDYPAAGANDRDPVWQPDGNRMFFASDRDPTTKSLQIYRWNPKKESVDQRSSGKLAQEHPIFQEDGALAGDNTVLVIKAGVVVEFNPTDGSAHQRVPVEGKTPTQTGAEGTSGMGNQFGPEYDHLGSSFREAHWCKNRKYIAGVMRGDEGETLVVICLDPGANPGQLDDGLPHGIVKGDHVDMAVDPSSGNLAYSVTNFRFPDPSQIPASMIKNGKVTLPFRNLLGFVKLDDFKGIEPIAAMPNSDHAFAEPQISPDGSQVAFIEGADTKDGFKSQALFIAPFATGGGHSAKPLVTGKLSSPCWSPDGKQIAFVGIAADGHGDIEVVQATGGSLNVITGGKGNFSSPRYSPQIAKPGS
ncbi:MAG TPA: hypothetical protein VKR27_00335, partial [Acidimicrobiales bacterium]|nr:hypothetical protein [Acidimicrobiales bacterium]